MIELIAGNRGKGKTKVILDRVNNEIKTINGNIVYLDKNTKHMYELNNKIRLINAKEFSLHNSDEFVGFIYGIISQDHDLEEVYVDGFLNIACLEDQDVTNTLEKLKQIGDQYQITFVISISLDQKEIPEQFQSYVVSAL